MHKADQAKEHLKDYEDQKDGLPGLLVSLVYHLLIGHQLLLLDADVGPLDDWTQLIVHKGKAIFIIHVL